MTAIQAAPAHGRAEEESADPGSDRLAGFLQSAIAEEIRHVRKLIEQLAEVLVSDERFAMNYIDQLQTFDLIIQHVDESASLLDRIAAGTESNDALKSVRLEGLQGRLREALAQAG